MKHGHRFLRFLLTVLVFVLVAYAFSIVWSPQNIARFREGLNRERYNGTEGNVRPVVGPAPIITFDAMRHIIERHADPEQYPEKSKFLEEIDLTEMVEVTYLKCDKGLRADDKYVYEYESDDAVGKRGERRVRLVTADDGTVITLYPVPEKKGVARAAA